MHIRRVWARTRTPEGQKWIEFTAPTDRCCQVMQFSKSFWTCSAVEWLRHSTGSRSFWLRIGYALLMIRIKLDETAVQYSNELSVLIWAVIPYHEQFNRLWRIIWDIAPPPSVRDFIRQALRIVCLDYFLRGLDENPLTIERPICNSRSYCLRNWTKNVCGCSRPL